MTKSKPNIHILELYNRYYMYDAGTNAIFSITKEMCRFLMAILNSNGEIEAEVLKEFHKREKEGTLPVPLDPEHKVAEFVGDDYGHSRFKMG